ncbi:MAG TPA: SOS response-associated peptidase [Ruminococcaceae bacterium]|jgi:putative SOS response-associated peptidase YedK|nr:SOS response-associated peptidase [Oscillospiraceae bacterium]
MCGRYALFLNPELRDLFLEMQKNNQKFNTGEIFPTDKAPILMQEYNKLTPEAVKWGFPSYKGKGIIINARAETAPLKPMFRNCILSSRCVIPSSGFYEWSHDGKKTKYLFTLPKSSTLYMAGLFRKFGDETRFVILTTAANDSMAEVHNRMPVVLNRERMGYWVNDTTAALEILKETPPELMKTPEKDQNISNNKK